ncbi:MAG TPA: type II toxin-antitoxin system prevent-host-death family antitoxin [Candidatus Omnitrophota bacterium]|nr:type II toxin-antitoxin system prevent-host-death family antitoxin [Candidatus Omnitrophota bacterium]
MRNISAADANRHFSRILRDVQAGETVTVTSRGNPVATIQPAASAAPDQNLAKGALLTRLRAQAPAGATWRRGELYDDGANG